MKGIEKIVVCGDMHIAEQDDIILKLFLRFLKKEQPDTLVLNGDILDFYDLSRFDKQLAKEGMLQYELDK